MRTGWAFEFRKLFLQFTVLNKRVRQTRVRWVPAFANFRFFSFGWFGANTHAISPSDTRPKTFRIGSRVRWLGVQSISIDGPPLHPPRLFRVLLGRTTAVGEVPHGSVRLREAVTTQLEQERIAASASTEEPHVRSDPSSPKTSTKRPSTTRY